MTREELLRVLKECEENGDTECAHADADRALLAYIGNAAVTKAYNRVSKWYA